MNIDIGALIVVAEQDNAITQFLFGGANALTGSLVGQGVEAVK